jgi:hypothetical protein
MLKMTFIKVYTMRFVVLLIFIGVGGSAFGQEDERPVFWDRVFWGGNFGFMGSNGGFVVDISPLGGYHVTNDFSLGAGITYQYVKIRHWDANPSIYGGNIFARHRVVNNIFAHVEYEALNVLYYAGMQKGYIREWVSGFLVGGSLIQPMGRRSGMVFSALYNLTYDFEKSPYASPWIIRVGFML